MKKDRHSMVEVNCEICGEPFLARRERVEIGLGKYCSKAHSYIGRNRIEMAKWGRKDLAKAYKIGGKYCARWYDENGRTCSTSYQRWWWEMNVGEVPEGMVVLLKDNNPLNIDPSNFKLGTRLDATNKAKETLRGDYSRWSIFKDKQRKKIQKMRDDGRLKYSGEKHWKWKGGIDREYPKEFNEALRDFIKSRDNHQCQICYKNLYRSRYAEVHHRDGNKNNNDQGNLILLCKSCHSTVHGRSQEISKITALREELC